MAHRLVDQREPLGDHLLIPLRTVLIVEQDHRTLGIEARSRPRMLQEKQRRQPHDLGFALEQPQQQPREANSLFAQRRANFGGIAARRITFVEDQIDHRGNGDEPLAALDRARGLERHVSVGNAGFRPGDALLHRGFRDQEGARDLFDAKSGDDAQRERDLLCRRQVGMAADEQ